MRLQRFFYDLGCPPLVKSEKLDLNALSPVAYAGFSKGLGTENLRLMKTKMKIFQPKTKSVFLPKIR